MFLSHSNYEKNMYICDICKNLYIICGPASTNTVYLSIVITVHTDIFIGICFYIRPCITFTILIVCTYLEQPVRACVRHYILFRHIEICNKTNPFLNRAFPRFSDYFS